MSLGNSQTMDAALDGLLAHLNNYRGAGLTQARADYVAANGPWLADQEVNGQFYPSDGPVIPKAELDNPADIRFKEGRIYRRLTLFSDNVRGLPYVGGNSGGEPDHTHQLEWSVLCSASENAARQHVFRRGRQDIAAALNPLLETGLRDPDTNEMLAISFGFGGIDFQTHDIGDHIIQAAFIGLTFTLCADSILS